MSPDEVSHFSQSQGDHITLNVIKYNFSANSSVMLSSSPSSGHNLTESSPDGLSLSPRSPQLHHRSWTSQSPDSSTNNNKVNLSLKCSGSQTDSLDSPQPSVRGGWSSGGQEKSSHRHYTGHQGRPLEYDSDRKKDPEPGYVKRSRDGEEYDQSPLVVDGHRHRPLSQHGPDIRRSHDERSRDQRQRPHDHQESRRSRDLTDHRSRDLTDHRSRDLSDQQPPDMPDQRRSHDQDQRSHDQHGRTRGDGDKTKSFDKVMSHFQKQSRSATERKVRDTRCKSGHPFFNIDSEHTTEEEVIEELNAMINQFASQTGGAGGVSKSKDKRLHRGEKQRQENGGTWPTVIRKCRGDFDDNNGVFLPPTVVKERAPIPEMIPEMSHSQSYQQRQDGKMPPTPPERTDSFKRSASIKHSPQNSDSSKYSHYSGSPQSKSPHQGSYITSPGKSPDRVVQQPSEEKKTSINLDSIQLDSSWSSTPSQEYSKEHYSPHSSLNSSTQDSLDYSVKSANNQQDISKYVRNRPTSAPNQSRSAKMKARAEERRRESQDGHHGQRSHSRSRQLQEIAEMLSRDCAQTAGQSQQPEYLPQKPKSLDIQPMYSPRPLPHTGHTITPGNPHTGHTITPSNPVSPPGYVHSKPSHPLSSSGSGPLSPRENKPFTSHSHLKSPQSYPTR